MLRFLIHWNFRAQTVFLIGGLTASNHLLRQLTAILKPHRLQVFRPNIQVYVLLRTQNYGRWLTLVPHRNKAVSDGAVFATLSSLDRLQGERANESFESHTLEVPEGSRPGAKG